MARIAVLTGVAWARAQPRPAPAARINWRRGERADAGLRLAWRVAERRAQPQRLPWAPPLGRDSSARLKWGRGLPTAAPVRPRWAAPGYRAAAVLAAWGRAQPRAGDAVRSVWLRGAPEAAAALAVWGRALLRAGDPLRILWPGASGITTAARLPWGRHWHPLGAPVPIIWDHEPEPVAGVVVPLRLVYRMFNTITIRPVGDTDELPCSSVTIAQDADSWAYSVDVEILGRSEWQRVAPADSEPVEVEIIVNGHTFRALIESCEGGHEHARLPTGRARGRSLSARLAGEYSAPRDYTETAARTLAQLADQELPATGWTLDWQCPDWTVPAGAWSYQSLPPIAAMARVVEAAGGILVPARSAQTLVAMPRWPVLPWAFAGATPDVEIPLDAVLSATEALPMPGDPANAVYVIGGDVGGVLGWVRRTGSAGDRLLPPISEPLATAEAAARARGGRAIADQWPAPAYTGFTLPLSPVGGDFPLLDLGQLVSLTGAGAPVRGIVSSVTITGRAGQRGGLVVEQQVGIGPRSRNAWSAWRRLTAPEPLLPATITADLGAGRCLAALAIGGAEIPARGVATVGAAVWIRGGRIEGEAPGLVGYSVDV